MIRTVLRVLAWAVAVAAAIDPGLRTSGSAPLAVDLRAADGTLLPSDSPVGKQLEQSFSGPLAINTAAEPRALVVEGAAIRPFAIPNRLPVSFIAPAQATGPSVRVLSVSAPRPVLPGWSAAVTAVIDGRGLPPGSSSAIVLDHHGVEVDRLVHRWNKPREQFSVQLSFVPPAAGSFPVSVKVLPIEGGPDDGVEAPSVQVVAEQRRLQILAFDPRPSWGSAFVRRALEADPSFDVATRVRASRGREVRTGAAPIVLGDATLAPFDLVLVGAPEELSASELRVLDRFASVRGGTVVFVADRASAGGYLRLLGIPSLDETLLDTPIKVSAPDGGVLRGAEFAHPAAVPTGADAVTEIPHGAGRRAPLVTRPSGAGLFIFSGLLDAWRYRAEDDGAFDTFWRSRLASAAARAPRRLELTLTSGNPSAGVPTRVQAVVRATDFATLGSTVSVPGVAARIVDERGAQEPIRLWPTAVLGVFEGEVPARSPGRYDVRIETSSGVSADTPLIVSPVADVPRAPGDRDLAATTAAATGGVVVAPDRLQPLIDRLSALSRESIVRTGHPFRSPWWGVAFAGLLTAEWTLRRRRGLR